MTLPTTVNGVSNIDRPFDSFGFRSYTPIDPVGADAAAPDRPRAAEGCG
jgi:hypothetical protein